VTDREALEEIARWVQRADDAYVVRRRIGELVNDVLGAPTPEMVGAPDGARKGSDR
jgi:hypothetical protein